MAVSAATVAVAVVASAVTSFFVGRATARDAAPADPGASSMKESLRDVERTLDEIRRSLAQRPALAAAPGSASAPAIDPRASTSPPTTRGNAPVADEPTGGARLAPPANAESAPMLPAANLARAKDVHGWDSNEDVRRRWFLVSETEALAAFGTPHTMGEWGGGERWDYSNEEWNLTLCFLRGRLVNVYSTDKRR